MAILSQTETPSTHVSEYSHNAFGAPTPFWAMIGVATLLAFVVTPYPELARWVGFSFAAYSAVANDSIQTLGTFIASNKQRPWWILWLFAGSIFVATMSYSWFTYAGDVSFQRLVTKGFEQAPQSFSVLQILAPIVLIVLTRWKMPVSTTFLLLTSFSTEMKTVGDMVNKSLTGYVLAFVLSIALWGGAQRYFEKKFVGQAHPLWAVGQWISTSALWSVWLMQDAANIAVYLPRQLHIGEFIAFLLIVVLGLGWIFKTGGDKIQEVVDEKSGVQDIRSATIIDALYAVILFYCKMYSNIPMSTTWVFLGLLAGREIAISLRSQEISKHNYKHALWMMTKDASLATIGLVVSFLVALAINANIL